MGPSGVGKSTLVRNIVGLQAPDEGSVLIGGQDVWSFTPVQWREIRGTVGAMIGGSYLMSASTFGSLTVLENLAFTLEAVGVPVEERHPRVMARLRGLGLLEYHDRRPEDLPAHATRRVALGKALILDAPLTILDEVDVGLDDQHSNAVVDSIAGLRERTNGTMLVTTHNIELARKIADHLVVLVNGRVVASGPPVDLLHGVHLTDEFDQVFRFSELPSSRMTEAELDRRQQSRRASDGDRHLDPFAVGVLVMAVVLIVALGVAHHLRIF
jgi:phospholipid/cholesterol/gamma-HCH transport system ATP-binding protein